MVLAHKLSPSLIVLMRVSLVAKSEPNTNVNLLWCNENSYAQEDPYANRVAYVLADLMNVTPTRQGFDHYTVSPYAAAESYGHATCNTVSSNSDCANRLVSAKATASRGCLDSVGGRVEMVDCTMRYENYPF